MIDRKDTLCDGLAMRTVSVVPLRRMLKLGLKPMFAEGDWEIAFSPTASESPLNPVTETWGREQPVTGSA